MTLQNQKVTEENINIFKQFWFVRSNYKTLSRTLSGKKLEKKIQHRILTYSRVNRTLRSWLLLSENHSLLLLNKKKLNINTIELNFVRNTSSMFYPVTKYLKIKIYSPSNTRGIECHRYPINFNRQKISHRTR